MGFRVERYNQRKRDEFLRYCGTSEPDDYHIQKAAQFISEAKSPFICTEHKSNPSAVRTSAAQIGHKHFIPGSARDGAGMLWLKLFADYRGDKCLLFPFRTASTPRGKVSYNFREMSAHRAMCLHVHKLPKDETKTMALHKCGNGHLGCVNPKHLYWGDQSDNNKDAWRHRKEGKQAA
jgi:hypothetical protein